jgi:hypothetical protein
MSDQPKLPSLPEPVAYTTQIKEGRVLFEPRVSLNTQGMKAENAARAARGEAVDHALPATPVVDHGLPSDVLEVVSVEWAHPCKGFGGKLLHVPLGEQCDRCGEGAEGDPLGVDLPVGAKR